MWVQIPAYTYLALLLWLPFSAVVFSQFPTTKAAFIVAVAGMFVLPELAAFDPPLLPAMDKNGIAMACAFMGIAMREPKRIARAKPMRGVDLWMLFMFVGAVGTAMTNKDGFQYGGGLHWNEVDHFPIVTIPPLRAYDAVSMVVQDLITFWLPFFLGRAVIGTREELDEFLRLMAFLSCAAVPLIAVEIVMSPQLHRWVYGYHATSFAHAMRGGGFKPTLFVGGGLALAMFQYVGLTCAAACVRRKLKLPLGIPAGAAVAAIAVAMMLSRSVGVLIYAGATLPLFIMFGSGMQLRAGLVILAIFTSFPYTRATKLFPVEQVLGVAADISEKRYESLKFRFDNEDVLLERAMERPTWGWGSFGRNRIYDPWTGRDESVTDGEWVTHLGSRGTVMAIGWFGILVWPVLMAWRTAKKVMAPHDKIALGILGLALAIHALDMLPNSSFNSMLYFFAGVVVGAVRVTRTPAAPTAAVPVAPARVAPLAAPVVNLGHPAGAHMGSAGPHHGSHSAPPSGAHPGHPSGHPSGHPPYG